MDVALIARPPGPGWRKSPAVTPGGCPYFWYRRFQGRHQWMVYDRLRRQWLGIIDPRDAVPTLAPPEESHG